LRPLALYAIVFVTALLLGACGRQEPSYVTQESAIRLKAYAFGVINTTDLPISGIHLAVSGEPSEFPPRGPRRWGGIHGPDGIRFTTPPEVASGSRSSRPIMPGQSAGPFTFTLSEDPGPGSITFTHPGGNDTGAPAGSITRLDTMDDSPIEQSPDGLFRLPPNDDLHSFTVVVTAPQDQPVSRVLFKIVGEGDFDGAVTQNDWRVAPVGGRVTCWSPGDRTPVKAGNSQRFTLFTALAEMDLKWELTAVDRSQIASGITSLAHR
jgi:hypothetical protein